MKCLPATSGSERGFTLVELLVAISIFVIVMLIGVGSLMTMLDANLKSRNQRLVFNNINVAMDSIVREVREGSEFVLDGGPSYLRFTNGDDDTVEVYLDSGVVYRVVDGGTPIAMTPAGITVTNLMFDEVPFSGDPDQEYEKILLVLSGETQTGDPEVDSEFTLQTTIARDLAVQLEYGQIDPVNPVCVLNYDQNDYYLEMEHGRPNPFYVGNSGNFAAYSGDPSSIMPTSDYVYLRQVLPSFRRGTSHPAGNATPYYDKPYNGDDSNPSDYRSFPGAPSYTGNGYIWTRDGSTATIPNGTYDILVQTYDNHANDDPTDGGVSGADCVNGLAWESHDQPHERLYLQYWDGNSWEEMLGDAPGVGLIEQNSALAASGFETTAGYTADVPSNGCNQITRFENVSLPTIANGRPIRTVHCVPTPGFVGGEHFGGNYTDSLDACGNDAGSMTAVCAVIEMSGGFGLGGGREE